MKFSKITGFSLALNLVLGVSLVWIMAQGSGAGPLRFWPGVTSTGDSLEPLVVTNLVEVPVTNAFHWSQLESDDYRTYIRNLQKVGCPIQTIRDIIIADLDMLWAPQLWSIYPRKKVIHYWESFAEELANNHDPRDWIRQERSIDREKREVIRELIGVDLVSERKKQQGKEDDFERRLEFLPSEKRIDVRNVVEQYQEEEWKILEKQWEEGVHLNAEDRARLAEIKALRKAELDQLLTPQEREQFDLWMSPTADVVRHDMYGMKATEEEFRKVFELQEMFDTHWGVDSVDFTDPDQVERWDTARSSLEQQVKMTLGEERFSEYQRGKDEDFHNLNAAVSRYDLDRDKAVDVYEMKRTLQTMREAVVSDPGLTMVQKEETLAAMDQETKTAVKEVLGENAYNYYRRRAGWLGP